MLRLKKICAAALFLLLGLSNGAAIADDKLTKKADELNRLRTKIHALQESLQKQTAKQDSLQNELRKSEIAISKLNRKINTLNRDLSASTSKLQTLKRDQLKQQRALSSHQVILSQQLRMSFTNGQQEYIKMLLNQQDPMAVNRVMKYYDYFNLSRLQHINDAADAFNQYERATAAVQLQTTQIEQQRDSIERQRNDISTRQSKRKSILAKLKSKKLNDAQRLKQFQVNEQTLAKLIGQLQTLIQDIPRNLGGRFSANRGKLAWPANGRVIIPRSKPKRYGVLINGSEGSSVTSIFNGRIAYADWLRGFGLLIIIDHGDGYMSLYGHNQSLLKEVGDWVKTGEQIATVGDSGGRQSAQLYFEIRQHGTPKNPKKWCRS